MLPACRCCRLLPAAYLRAMHHLPARVQELLEKEAAAAAGPSYAQVDVDDLLDDPDLERLHAERLAAMQREAEKRVKMQQKGHGESGGPEGLHCLILIEVVC